MSADSTLRLAPPQYRPVGAQALLVEFGELFDEQIRNRVVGLDEALKSRPFIGFVEAVPAYTSLLVCFDPLMTDHRAAEKEVGDLIADGFTEMVPRGLREVDVCYDLDLAPDLPVVAKATGLTPEQVVEAHLAGEYSVFMYGFAPGYAYLAGVPDIIQLPRKTAAVRGIPAGSVLIAGPQCLVSTLTMPTGWWIIGQSTTKILDPDCEDRPFLFDVGDQVRFRRIARTEFDARTEK